MSHLVLLRTGKSDEATTLQNQCPSPGVFGMVRAATGVMQNRFQAACFMLAIVAADPVSADSAEAPSGLRFFEGRTESVSTTKVTMQKPYRTHWTGQGKIKPDGSLEFNQHVKEEGRREFNRRWLIRQVARGRFTGTMSEAVGPVTIDMVGERYRFRFKLKGNLSVEQWITPGKDRSTARTQVTVRKYGMAVARGDGWIRRSDPTVLGEGPCPKLLREAFC